MVNNATTRASYGPQRTVLGTGTEADTDARFWRMDPPDLDSAGKIIRGGLWPYQREWWELPTFIKLFVGGYGAGKTFVAAKRAISSCLLNAPAPVATVSPTYGVARDTIILTLREMLAAKAAQYGSSFQWRLNKTYHTFTIRHGTRTGTIRCYSGEDPDNLKGPNLGSVYIDEPFILHVDVFKQMVARVRHPKAKRHEIGLTGTPEQLNWGYELSQGGSEEIGTYDVGVVNASSLANLALPKAYHNRLMDAFTDKEAEAYVQGKFVNLSRGLVYHAFNGTPNVGHVLELPEPPGAVLGVGMDFNVDPMTAVVFWIAGQHIHFIREYEMPNADTHALCAQLREHWVRDRRDAGLPVLEVVYPDASGVQRSTAASGAASDYDAIKECGFRIDAGPSNPRIRDRHNAVNSRFKTRKGERSLTVAPRCRKLIRYLSSYSYKEMHKQKHMSHLTDAAAYPVARLFPLDKNTLDRVRLRGL